MGRMGCFCIRGFKKVYAKKGSLETYRLKVWPRAHFFVRILIGRQQRCSDHQARGRC